MKYTQDSREVKKGDCFVALSGETTDGHKFIPKALARGAAKIVFHDESYKETIPKSRQLYVLDTETWLQKEAVRKLTAKHIVSIGGSVGKTTTVQLFAHIISNTKSTFAHSLFVPEVGINTLRGICLEILNKYLEEKLVVLETGMDQYRELDKIARVLRPNIAAITSIDVSHIEKLQSMDRIIRTKFGLCTKELDHLILNGQNKFIANFMKDQFQRFVASGEFTKPSEIHFVNPDNAEFKISPSHLRINLSIALEIIKSISPEIFQQDLQPIIDTFKGSLLRFEEKSRNGQIILNDSYNAAPISYKAFYEYCSKQPQPRLGIIGQINEIAPISEEVHKKIVEKAERVFSDIILVGPELKPFSSKSTPWFETNTEVAAYLKAHDSTFSYPFVGVKASRGIELDMVVEEVWGTDS